jgi:2,5-diketo-D-gluconate reductase B
MPGGTADTAAGTSVPPLGLGTWNMDGEECTRTVERALELGYRHIDTAQLYGNEQAVGSGLTRADVPREDVSVATKVAPERLGREDLAASVRESRERLGVEHIDCLYVHWPRAAYDPTETLDELDGLVEEGIVGGIGLSNFTPTLLNEARDRLDSPVVAHQVELHPLLPQEELLDDAREHGHALVAYSPLARGKALALPPVRTVASEYDATPAQVVLAWSRAKGVVPIPKATGDHLEENRGSLALRMDESDLRRIDAVEGSERLVDPPSAPWNRPESTTGT